jgi:hypothetical protein
MICSTYDEEFWLASFFVGRCPLDGYLWTNIKEEKQTTHCPRCGQELIKSV